MNALYVIGAMQLLCLAMLVYMALEMRDIGSQLQSLTKSVHRLHSKLEVGLKKMEDSFDGIKDALNGMNAGILALQKRLNEMNEEIRGEILSLQHLIFNFAAGQLTTPPRNYGIRSSLFPLRSRCL